MGVPAGTGQPSEMCVEQTKLCLLADGSFFSYVFSTFSWLSIDRAEMSRALPPTCFFFSIMPLTSFLSFALVAG